MAEAPGVGHGRTLIVLTPHPDRPALLTRYDGRLPTATVDGDDLLETVLTGIESVLGSLPPVLRIMWRPPWGSSARNGEVRVVLVDLETPGPVPPEGFAWTDWSTLAIDRLEPAALRDELPRWVGRRADGPRPNDPRWSIPGWFARASAWMSAQMTEAGAPPADPPRIVAMWGLSIIVRAASPGGAMFLKSSTSVFAGEGPVTTVLAEATPHLLPDVVAVEPLEGWMLMRDFGDSKLEDAPPETWAAGLEAFADIQRTWSGRTRQLVRAGAALRPLSVLAEALPTFVDREPLASTLLGEDRAVWLAALPSFVAASRRLDQLGPAPTLVHGDLHPGNIADTPTGLRIFDWTDAAISHPFLDLSLFATKPDDLGLRRMIRDRYLARWADALPAPELAEAGELAIVVGSLYQVDTYLRLVPTLEPEDAVDLVGSAANWAKSAVRALREGIDVQRSRPVLPQT